MYATCEKLEGGVSGFLGMMILKSHNYVDWKIKMEDLLIIKDLYEPIDREQIPTRVLESEWKLLNRKESQYFGLGKWGTYPQC